MAILPINSPIFGASSAEWAKRNMYVSPVGTEEMAHWEMIGTMIHQCMTGATCEELRAAGLDGYYVIHSHGVFPVDPNGVPFTSSYIQCTGDPIADISEDMAAEVATLLRLPADAAATTAYAYNAHEALAWMLNNIPFRTNISSRLAAP